MGPMLDGISMIWCVQINDPAGAPALVINEALIVMQLMAAGVDVQKITRLRGLSLARLTDDIMSLAGGTQDNIRLLQIWV